MWRSMYVNIDKCLLIGSQIPMQKQMIKMYWNYVTIL